MNCPELPEISKLIDGELSPERELKAREHLHDCRECMFFYRESETITSTLLRVEPFNLTELAQTVKAQIIGASNHRHFQPWIGVPAFALLLLLALGLGNIAGKSFVKLFPSQSHAGIIDFLENESTNSVADVLAEFGMKEKK